MVAFFVVARVDDDHVREGPHEGDVLHRLVGRSVLSEGDSCMGGSDLDIGLAVADLHPDLVVDTSGHEFGEGSHEGNLPGDCHTGGDADHVGLGDSALEVSLGEGCGELVHLERSLEVGGQRYDPAVSLSGFEKACSETAARVFLSFISIFLHGVSD